MKRKKGGFAASIYSFALMWLLCSFILPLYTMSGLLVTILASVGVGMVIGSLRSGRKAKVEEKEPEVKAQPQPEPEPKKSYGPEVDAIIADGNLAMREMGRLYSSIKEPNIRSRINEIMRVSDKIVQDAIADPSDVPQIRRFLDYYLPTTIKLLNAYDRMSSQGIEGENLSKSMKSIEDMLDTAVVAYEKQLDSLFANQALDIETDISVMNTMLAREGLQGEDEYDEILKAARGTSAGSGAGK